MKVHSVWISAMLGLAACSSEMSLGSGPTGESHGALGAIGEPPNTDGSCDLRLTACSNVCVDLTGDPSHCGSCGTVCATGDSCNGGQCVAPSTPADAGSPGDDAGRPVPGDDSGPTTGDDSSVATGDDGGRPGDDSGPTTGDDSSAPTGDGGSTFQLDIAFSGYDGFVGQDQHIYLLDTTTSAELACTGGSYVGRDVQEGLIAGHSYTYNYWLDTSATTSCVGSAVAPYHTYSFGPVTGDTFIVVTPSDPVTQ